MGQANDNIAIKITEKLKRPKISKSDIVMLEEDAPLALEHLDDKKP